MVGASPARGCGPGYHFPRGGVGGQRAEADSQSGQENGPEEPGHLGPESTDALKDHGTWGGGARQRSERLSISGSWGPALRWV